MENWIHWEIEDKRDDQKWEMLSQIGKSFYYCHVGLSNEWCMYHAKSHWTCQNNPFVLSFYVTSYKVTIKKIYEDEVEFMRDWFDILLVANKIP